MQQSVRGWREYAAIGIMVILATFTLTAVGAFGPDNANAAVSYLRDVTGSVHNKQVADGTLTWRDQGPYMRSQIVVKVAYADNGDIVTTYLDGHTSTSANPGGGDGGGETPQTCQLADGIDRSITTDSWNYPAPQKVGPAKVKVSDTGKVHLSISDATSYVDAGVVTPLGTVDDVFNADGSLKDLAVTGAGKDKVNSNLWVDATGDGAFGPDTKYNGVESGKDSYWFYGNHPTRDDLAGIDGSAKVWAWTGVTVNSGSMKATLKTVNGTDLSVCS